MATLRQIEHENKICREANLLMHMKYKKGAEEHNDNLDEHSVENLLDNAIDEALDQIIYLLTLKEKLNLK